jgi:hypothetical protein
MDSSADKEGLQSSGRKEESSRHGVEPTPAAGSVQGAFGREGDQDVVPQLDEDEIDDIELDLDEDELDVDDEAAVTDEEAERADGA